MTSAWANVPRCFSLDEIRRMTNDFNPGNQLGSYGEQVYKGVMFDTGEVVAVNRVPVDVNFRRQLKMLPGIHHNNLVRCLGFCFEKSEQILVFEDTPNGTLRSWLKGDKTDVNHNNWQARKRICFGVADGIQYLHTEMLPKCVHQNINPHSILLDANLEPKIAGFQLAVLCTDELRAQEIKCRDSNWYYTAPEYELRGHLSEKVDVYSYGIVLLEIVSGGRAHVGEKSAYGYHFLKREEGLYYYQAWELHCLDVIEETVDRSLDLQPNEYSEAIRIMKIALLCTHKVPERRPDISLVVAMLHGQEDAQISSLLAEHKQERRH